MNLPQKNTEKTIKRRAFISCTACETLHHAGVDVVVVTAKRPARCNYA